MQAPTEPPPLALATSPLRCAPPCATLVDALLQGAELGAPFVRFHSVRGADELDARAALALARRWALLLRRSGVTRGDRVLLLLPTGPTFVAALLGAHLLGAAAVPLATPMSFGGAERFLVRVRAIARDAEARALVTDARLAGELAAGPPMPSCVAAVLVANDLAGVEASAAGVRWPSVDPGDIALVQYTSGTTGAPKGAMLSHRALTSNAYGIARALALTDRDVGVSWLPLYHDMGLIGAALTALCHRYPLHLLPTEAFLLRPERWLALLAEHRATLSAAPNFAYELCVARNVAAAGSLAPWRRALNGAEPVLAGTVRRFSERYAAAGFAPEAMAPVYGLAESCLAVTMPAAHLGFASLPVDRAALEQRGVAVGSVAGASSALEAVSVGGPIAGTSVAACDANGAVLREGQVGELCVRGASLMSGYLRNEAATAEALRGGWLHTGDLGFLRGGRVYVVGRAREVIIKAGRNLHPHEIEQVVAQIAGVRGGVAALGRRNEDAGTDDVIVVAETAERDPAARARLEREVVGELLAALNVKADEVHLWPVGSVPRTTSGKVRRADCLRALAQRSAP